MMTYIIVVYGLKRPIRHLYKWYMLNQWILIGFLEKKLHFNQIMIFYIFKMKTKSYSSLKKYWASARKQVIRNYTSCLQTYKSLLKIRTIGNVLYAVKTVLSRNTIKNVPSDTIMSIGDILSIPFKVFFDHLI